MLALIDEYATSDTITLDLDQLRPSPFSRTVYGDPAAEVDDLIASVREHGILVPLVVAAPGPEPETWEVISGHRRLACARAIGMVEIPCQVRQIPEGEPRRAAVLEYNRQRRKTFSQLMREADALEQLWGAQAKARRRANLLGSNHTECRNSDDRTTGTGRTDAAIARHLGLGGKDLYRQARALWRMAASGDTRAQSGVDQLDRGTKTIHAAYKDLRRRDRFGSDFRPTPYDVWAFRHDRAFGIPHPGSIPPALVAHALHYFTAPGSLVVDPMAGGGTTLDVCQSMGRRCLAYDLHPVRPEIRTHDVRLDIPSEAHGADLIFCDPPYHTMLAARYAPDSVATASFTGWMEFLHDLARHAFDALRPGGYLALLLAAQTEKDIPAGFGYIDHAFLGYEAARRAGFLPERRISCPMDGAYLPQHVRRARTEGRLLGQVRDLLVMRRPSRPMEGEPFDLVPTGNPPV